MLEYGFYLSRIFSYKDKIVDSVLIREKTGQRATIFLHILRLRLRFTPLTPLVP